MIIQVVKFKSELDFEEVQAIAKERAPRYREVSGLLQKYYARTDEPGRYVGVRLWEDRTSLQRHRESDLAQSIKEAYKVPEPPEIEVYDVAFRLREHEEVV